MIRLKALPLVRATIRNMKEVVRQVQSEMQSHRHPGQKKKDYSPFSIICLLKRMYVICIMFMYEYDVFYCVLMTRIIVAFLFLSLFSVFFKIL